MKSDSTNLSWVPTITLAKLFEEQNQYFDALAAYELIGQNDSSPAIRQKIEALQLRILNDPNAKYDPRIEKLFSQEELAYLKILNHSAFENLSRIQQQLQNGISDYEVVFDEEDDPFSDVQTDELTQLLSEIENEAATHPQTANPDFSDSTIGDFILVLLKRYGKDKKISQLTIKEIFQLIVELYLNQTGNATES